MHDGPSPSEIKRLLAPLITRERKRRIAEILQRRTRYVTLVLDNLYHQHNMSAVVRSCEAFGFQDLYVIEGENRFKPAHGVAMGAEQWITIFRHESADDCLSALEKAGYRVFAADPPEKAMETMGGAAIAIDELDLDGGPVAIVLGRELDGIDSRLRSRCEGTVFIPMHGFTESLNVSVTAALFLYRLRLKLQRLPEEITRLPDRYMEELEALWYVRSVKKGQQILKELLHRERKDKTSTVK